MERLGHLDLISQMSLLLNRSTVHHHDSGEISISGHLGCLHVSATQTGLRVNGSLPKYLKGENVSLFSRADIYRGIEKISDHLGVNAGVGKVTRLHFGATLKSKYSPSTYYKYLGDAHYYIRRVHKKSLYYENEKRQIIIYDKLNETGSAKIPKDFQGFRLMRIECKLERSLERFLKRPSIYAADLWSKELFNDMAIYWQNSYNKIEKERELNFANMRINKPKDFIEMLAAMQIKSLGGSKEAFKLVEEFQEKQQFSRPEYPSRTKVKIRQLAKKASSSEPNGLIKELNLKVEATAKEILNNSILP
ncbi:MAG: hypothetical protein MRZ79_13410 [Bacteroidia bacterium]|nr:hypothetical protein [Bacteroidia bacterium]